MSAPDDDGPGAPLADLTIGLVNNMPDAALDVTERQFTSLLGTAAGERAVHLRLFALTTLPRGREALARLSDRYRPVAALGQANLDGLIVTGCEPRTPHLTEEPYWRELAQLVDWAADNTASTVWSCLAAHAAVLRSDGIARHKLPEKRFGVYTCEVIADSPLCRQLSRRIAVPQSRWNALDEDDLRRHGYVALTRALDGSVDMFTRRQGSLFVFFQGHPEYGHRSLANEFRRDLSRFVTGEQRGFPTMPRDYFDPATERTIGRLRDRASFEGRGLTAEDIAPDFVPRPGIAAAWQAAAVTIMSNWLSQVARTRRERGTSRVPQPAS